MSLATVSRERRDIVTGEVCEEARLIRFVAGPDGVVTPDLARKLPGRGLWVAADRASVETAAAKNLFARAAKSKLAAPADLADQVERLLSQRLLSALGLARKAGELTFGFERVLAAIGAGKAAWLAKIGSDDQCSTKASRPCCSIEFAKASSLATRACRSAWPASPGEALSNTSAPMRSELEAARCSATRPPNE